MVKRSLLPANYSKQAKDEIRDEKLICPRYKLIIATATL
jgi:hypothetical protein